MLGLTSALLQASTDTCVLSKNYANAQYTVAVKVGKRTIFTHGSNAVLGEVNFFSQAGVFCDIDGNSDGLVACLPFHAMSSFTES